MERQPVQSSTIASVGYDPAQQVLEVEFTRGGLYQYAGVTPEQHRRLLAAESIGRHFHAHIKTANFPCTKLPAAAPEGVNA